MASLNLIIKSYVVIHQEGMNPDLCDVFHDKVNLIAIVIASQGCSLEVFCCSQGTARQKCYFFAHVISINDTGTAGTSSPISRD